MFGGFSLAKCDSADSKPNDQPEMIKENAQEEQKASARQRKALNKQPSNVSTFDVEVVKRKNFDKLAN